MARRLLALLSLLGGCGYPEFAFSPADADTPAEDSAIAEDTEPADSSALDSEFVDSSQVDSARDETVVEPTDTAPKDTGATDTSPTESAPPPAPPSCRAIHSADPSAKSGTFTIDPDGSGPRAPYAVYCEMLQDGGGWTLIGKMDGTKTTFAFDASLWTDDTLLAASSTDLLPTEAKFRSWLDVSFTQMRARMDDAGTPRALVLDVAASSAKALFAGPRVVTKAGRDKWLALVSSGSLQLNCNDEGVNLDYSATMIGPKIRLRLGIVGNQEMDCSSPDSFLGFGAAISTDVYCFGGTDPGISVGDLADTLCDAPTTRHTPTFGMLFVR